MFLNSRSLKLITKFKNKLKKTSRKIIKMIKITEKIINLIKST